MSAPTQPQWSAADVAPPAADEDACDICGLATHRGPHLRAGCILAMRETIATLRTTMREAIEAWKRAPRPALSGPERETLEEAEALILAHANDLRAAGDDSELENAARDTLFDLQQLRQRQTAAAEGGS